MTVNTPEHLRNEISELQQTQKVHQIDKLFGWLSRPQTVRERVVATLIFLPNTAKKSKLANH